jgi:hypothetical protein
LIGLAYQFRGWPSAAAAIAVLFGLGAVSVAGIGSADRD